MDDRRNARRDVVRDGRLGTISIQRGLHGTVMACIDQCWGWVVCGAELLPKREFCIAGRMGGFARGILGCLGDLSLERETSGAGDRRGIRRTRICHGVTVSCKSHGGMSVRCEEVPPRATRLGVDGWHSSGLLRAASKDAGSAAFGGIARFIRGGRLGDEPRWAQGLG